MDKGVGRGSSRDLHPCQVDPHMIGQSSPPKMWEVEPGSLNLEGARPCDKAGREVLEEVDQMRWLEARWLHQS